jgi:hypothetical protein
MDKTGSGFTAHYDTNGQLTGRTTRMEEMAKLLAGSFGFDKTAQVRLAAFLDELEKIGASFMPPPPGALGGYQKLLGAVRAAPKGLTAGLKPLAGIAAHDAENEAAQHILRTAPKAVNSAVLEKATVPAPALPR